MHCQIVYLGVDENVYVKTHTVRFCHSCQNQYGWKQIGSQTYSLKMHRLVFKTHMIENEGYRNPYDWKCRVDKMLLWKCRVEKTVLIENAE